MSGCEGSESIPRGLMTRAFRRFEELKKPLAHAHGLAGCFFGNPELMPWLPKKAGDHGYGFIDRWCDGDELSEKPLQCAMFMPADKNGERWVYFGQ